MYFDFHYQLNEITPINWILMHKYDNVLQMFAIILELEIYLIITSVGI